MSRNVAKTEIADLKHSLTAFIDSSITSWGGLAIKAPGTLSILAEDILKNDRLLRKAEPGFWKGRIKP